MPVFTASVLAAQYKGRPRAMLTHAVDDRSGRPLCGKVNPESLCDIGSPHEQPTCPTCRKRDPRSRTGGPFILSSLLQF